MTMRRFVERSQVLLFLSLILQIHADCLYPEWKKTCQKYCMDHQFTDIQFNQCYSNHVKCQCNSQDLTDTIRMKFESNNQTTGSAVTTFQPTTSDATNSTGSCVANQSCVIGQQACQTKYSFCICENEKWISKICPQGQFCKKEPASVSCQMASSDDELSVSSSSSASPISVSAYTATGFLIVSSFCSLF